MIQWSDISSDELKVFLEETDEQIQLIDESLIRLEKDNDPELLQDIFRAAHTLKGSSGMIGHETMAGLTHAMESLLDKLRSGELEVSTPIIDALLHSLDTLKLLRERFGSEDDGGIDISALVSELQASYETTPESQAETACGLVLDQATEAALIAALAAGESVYRCQVVISPECGWAAVRFLQVIGEIRQLGRVLASAPTDAQIDAMEVGHSLEFYCATGNDADALEGAIHSIADIGSITLEPYAGADAAAAPTPAAGQNDSPDIPAPNDAKSAGAEKVQTIQTVRIDVDTLDNLMNMVGELVVDRSSIDRVSKMLVDRYADDDLIQDLGKTSSHIVKVINELQEDIMSVRMVPIGTVFSRFPRLVRDLAQKQSKQVNFEVEGEDTELDRTVIEQIRDPLIHLLRNAVDHGVESPADRSALGKSPIAQVRLAAVREQGHVIITLEDDGGGISPERVRNSAVKKGLITSEASEHLSDAEAINMIFLPGMSTAEKTTDVSGRGVGMDIVRTNIEALNGTVTLSTEAHRGTTFTIKLPLTVAIIRGLMVTESNTIYIVPLTSVMETLKIDQAGVQTLGRQRVIRVRDEIIPLIQLEDIFERRQDYVEEARETGDRYVVVVNVGNQTAGIEVDELMEQQEFVVKPMGDYLGDIRGIAGATILWDGSVALILDIGSLLRRVNKSVSQSSHKLAVAAR